jgi:hypothetical protein
MKCFLPNVTFGYYINLHSRDYGAELQQQILLMKSLVSILNIPEDENETNSNSIENNSIGATTPNFNTIVTEENKSPKIIANNCDINSDLNDENNKTEKIVYAIKIKQLGNHDPDPDLFNDSDIYINKKTKIFYVKSQEGFSTFPLIKQSIIKCEKA